jgi:hypothetical protein
LGDVQQIGDRHERLLAKAVLELVGGNEPAYFVARIELAEIGLRRDTGHVAQ